MTGFLRPEAVAALRRWREAALGVSVAAAGVWGIATASGVLFGVAVLAVPLGLGLLWEGIRRARLPEGGAGPGMVEVDERQITYFGPGSGAAVSIDALTRVEILTSDAEPFASGLVWVFQTADAPPLFVPGDAVGAEGLFDALTALPGVDFSRITAALGSTEPRRFVIWARTEADLRLT